MGFGLGGASVELQLHVASWFNDAGTGAVGRVHPATKCAGGGQGGGAACILAALCGGEWLSLLLVSVLSSLGGTTLIRPTGISGDGGAIALGSARQGYGLAITILGQDG